MTDARDDIPPLGLVLNALQCPERRQVLRRLANERDQEDSVESACIRVEDLDPPQVVLYHQHLPDLDGLEVIEWDVETDAVQPGARFDHVVPVLRLSDQLRVVEPHDDEPR